VELKKVYVAEYSAVQKQFHVDTLDRVIKVNKEAALDDVSTTYEIIGISTSMEEMQALVDHVRNKLNYSRPLESSEEI
jgi:hypothetical protein